MRTAVRINLIVLRCQDLEASKMFYERLGLQFVEEKHSTGPRHFSCSTGGVVLELYPLGQVSSKGTRIGFKCFSLEDLKELLRTEGIAIAEMDPGRIIIQDPDGHKVEIVDS